MQSTGHTSTHAVSLTSMQGSAMTYPFTAAAVEPTLVLLWSRADLCELFEAHLRLERNVLDVVGAHAREALDKFRELATEPVPRRLARTLLRFARLGRRLHHGALVIEHLRQRDLAEMAATSPFTVNRVLSEWESRAILETQRAGIVIHSPAQLRKIADG